MEAVALKNACPTCRGTGARVTAAGEYAKASLCTCQTTCARCEGTGRVYEEKNGYRFLAACSCQRIRQGIALYNQTQLPARCADQDFDTLQPSFPALESIKMIALGKCHQFVPGQTREGLLFSGPVGTGKTHLLAAILRYLTLEVRVPCRYVEISFLYSEIRRGFSEGRSSLQIIEPLAEIPVLAIDELGKGKMSPFEQETIDELVSRRYNAGKPTYFATNYTTAEKPERAGSFVSTADRVAEKGLDQPLRERVGERVWSRLQQMCYFADFPVSAGDFRKQLRSK